MSGSKIPISTLVLTYTTDLLVLLLERADFAGHWQSVTGSQEPGETLAQTARRELLEETGIDADQHGGLNDWSLSNVYEIFLQWRGRYPEGTVQNTEHVFGLELGEPVPIIVAPLEHRQYVWLPWQNAAERCFSWSNRDAILLLPGRVAEKGKRS